MDFTELICTFSRAYLAQSSQLMPTDDDFVGWVDSQPLAGRPLLYQLGPQECWQSGSFQAWVLEARGYSFADYLVHRLSTKDYLRWIDLFATTTLARYKNEYEDDGEHGISLNMEDYKEPEGSITVRLSNGFALVVNMPATILVDGPSNHAYPWHFDKLYLPLSVREAQKLAWANLPSPENEADWLGISYHDKKKGKTYTGKAYLHSFMPEDVQKDSYVWLRGATPLKEKQEE